VNDQKMGSQKLGAYEVRYKWKIQNSTSSVNKNFWKNFRKKQKRSKILIRPTFFDGQIAHLHHLARTSISMGRSSAKRRIRH
jgi:hypothetical protein